MLSTLSVELLQEIGNELGKIDQQRLRAVAKDVGLAINPLFFSSLTLKTNELRLESSVDMLTLLASRKTGWSCYARSLNITVWHSRSQPAQMDGQKSEKEDVRKRLDLSDDAMGSLLASALGSMTNICSVSWWASNSDPAWQRAPFLGFLASRSLAGGPPLAHR
ncbi:hypothetical protein MVEN_00618400 [Mycena venus]|uniref:Uncharacterized protein n=1 Tax=Mycena venus TaxID=2733690 RepID=A0A8H6YQV8_9AGAR|nr:hypothetical protein MVEN_00618400 [Mycena venus]